jgi:uncharacterized protein (DUF1800 family)
MPSPVTRAGIAAVSKRKRKRRKKKTVKCVKKLTAAQKRALRKKHTKAPPICKPKKKAPAVKTPAAPVPSAQPGPVPPVSAASGSQSTDPPSQPPAPAIPRIDSPVAMYSGAFGPAQAARLMHRAAFGPQPGDTARLSAMGMEKAILSLTRVSGDANLVGPAPTDKNGATWVIDAADVYEMDALYWFDRMMRSDQQIVERMALIFHDWFATNENGIPQLFMLNQTNLFRKYALGSFKDLVHDISADPAMILWLNLNKSVVNVANENYARELMELFTLGAGRGYTEQDIREAARALTGWTSNGDQEAHTLTGFDMLAIKHDQGDKTIFGKTGNWGWEDVARFVIENDAHPSYFVTKLWSYFIPTSPSDSDVQALAAAYKASGHQVRPILEAILAHPDFYTGPTMIKPPVVYVASTLRIRQKFIQGELYSKTAEYAGQRLYQPPDVGGWDDTRWLDSNTILARWQFVYQLMVNSVLHGSDGYDLTETPEQAVSKALDFWGNPVLREETRATLLGFARAAAGTAPDATAYAERQNGLRHLIAVSPDFQVC